MDQRVTIVTLGVRDVARSRAFYVDGLGWTPTLDLPEVVFVQVAFGVLLALWSADALEADATGSAGAVGWFSGSLPFSLACNVGSAAEVDAAVERVVAAGGRVTRPASKPTEFDGWSAYVEDPDGFRWEIAWNPTLTFDPETGEVRFG